MSRLTKNLRRLVAGTLKARAWSEYEKREPHPVRELRGAISDLVAIAVVVMVVAMALIAWILEL
ncbi:hypothetical protein [Aquamicrobium sp. LC103]|uniref:hypothetical protein n=1 Tax=Aquamicrobium sp. LC103 TaxID=1120658 RepID=UPI00063EA55B|nr:hypothetical protein [Aquamicrobium sp. LC103]TKT76332.1 hypothetical protein XW59_017340 [Aquamicrobium sp. LC103]